MRGAAAGLALLFNHFEEVGLNRAADNAIRENRNEVLQYAPQDRDLKVIQDILARKGISTAQFSIAKALGTANSRARGLSIIDRVGGVKEFADRLVVTVNLFADTLDKRVADARFGARYIPVLYSQSDGAEAICEALVFLASLWAVGCYFGCPVCCIAALALYIFAAWLDVVGFC